MGNLQSYYTGKKIIPDEKNLSLVVKSPEDDVKDDVLDVVKIKCGTNSYSSYKENFLREIYFEHYKGHEDLFPDSLLLKNIRDYFLTNRRYITQKKWIDLSSPDPIPNVHGSFAPGKKLSIIFSPSTNYDLIEKPIINLNLEKTNNDKSLTNNLASIPVRDIIRYVELEIAGERIERIYYHQFEYLYKYYGLTVHYGEDNIIFPLPFSLFYGKNTFLNKYHSKFKEIHINIETQSYKGFNVYASLRYDAIMVDNIDTLSNKKFVECAEKYNKLAEEKNVVNKTKYDEMVSNKDPQFADIIKYGPYKLPKLYYDPKNLWINEINGLSFTGEQLIESEKFNLYFNHPTTQIFFHFENKVGSVITHRMFNKVLLLLNGIVHMEAKYEELVADTTSFLNLSKGHFCLSISKDKRNMSSINASRIDKLELVFCFVDTIKSLKESETKLFATGMCKQFFIYNGGSQEKSLGSELLFAH